MEQLPSIHALINRYITGGTFPIRQELDKLVCNNGSSVDHAPTTTYDPTTGQTEFRRYGDVIYQTSIFKPLMNSLELEDKKIVLDAIHRHWASIYSSNKEYTTNKAILTYMLKFYHTSIEDHKIIDNIVFLYGAWLYLIEHGVTFTHMHVMNILNALDNPGRREAHLIENAVRIIAHHWRQTYNNSVQGQVVTVYAVEDVSDEYPIALHLDTICTTLEEN